jgi:hypothetical protein
MPLTIKGSKAFASTTAKQSHRDLKNRDVLVDTGSSLGLFWRTRRRVRRGTSSILYGLTGTIEAFTATFSSLNLNGYQFHKITSTVTRAREFNLSIGMGVMKNYVVILNFSQSYMALKPIEEIQTTYNK